MKKILISMMSCLCTVLLLLAGTTPAALGQSATANDALINQENEALSPYVEQQEVMHEATFETSLDTIDNIQKISATFGAGALIGFGTGALVTQSILAFESHLLSKEYPFTMPVDRCNVKEYSNHFLYMGHMEEAKGPAVMWGAATGITIGVLVTGALLFIFFYGYFDQE